MPPHVLQVDPRDAFIQYPPCVAHRSGATSSMASVYPGDLRGGNFGGRLKWFTHIAKCSTQPPQWICVLPTAFPFMCDWLPPVHLCALMRNGTTCRPFGSQRLLRAKTLQPNHRRGLVRLTPQCHMPLVVERVETRRPPACPTAVECALEI